MNTAKINDTNERQISFHWNKNRNAIHFPVEKMLFLAIRSAGGGKI